MIDIDSLIKQAMKSQNKTELRAYRNLKAEFLKAETAKDVKPMDEVRQIQVLQKYIKILEKSILDFSEAHREDLVADYKDELEVLKKLLPEPVNEPQLVWELFHGWYGQKPEGAVCSAVHLMKIQKKEMGSAIKYLKSKFPQADGKMVSGIVKKYIV